MDVIPIYDQIKDWIEHKDMNVANVFILTTKLIKIIEKSAADKTGEYKKDLLLETIRYTINHSKADDDIKKLLHEYVDTTLEITIEVLIKVARGVIDIGKYKIQNGCCVLN